MFKIKDFIPNPLPFGVRQIPYPDPIHSAAFRVQKGKQVGMLIIMSVVTYDDEWWQHISFSYSKKMPTWEDTTWVKEKMIGLERDAIVKIPKKSEYVNTHPFCLHIWSPLERERVTPDFRCSGQI